MRPRWAFVFSGSAPPLFMIAVEKENTMRRHSLLAVFAGLFVVFAVSAAFAAESRHPETGAAMKNGKVVSVPGLTATELLKKIADNKGKVVLVNIFASWCPPCREEVPTLIRLRNSLPADKIIFIGISVDQPEQALFTFMDKSSFNYPIFQASGNFTETVGVNAIPQTLVYDQKGELALNEQGLLPEKELTTFLQKVLK